MSQNNLSHAIDEINFFNEYFNSPGLSSYLKKIKRYGFKYLYYVFANKIGFSKTLPSKTFYGMVFNLPTTDALTPPVYFTGILGGPEHKLIQYISRNPQLCTCFYDVGSNFGFYAGLVRAINPTATVVAFEPNPSVFKRLVSALTNENFSAIQAAVSDRDGSGEFFDLSENNRSGASSIIEMPSEKTTSVSSVRLVKIDSIVAGGYPIPTFIKLDIEGAEIFAIRGALKTLKENRPLISLEIRIQSESDYANATNLLMELAAFGYRPHLIGDDATLREASLKEVLSGSDMRRFNFDNFIFKS